MCQVELYQYKKGSHKNKLPTEGNGISFSSPSVILSEEDGNGLQIGLKGGLTTKQHLNMIMQPKKVVSCSILA